MSKKKTFNEGIIPTSLGAIVTGVGAGLWKNKKLKPWAAGITGFGVAHILLGGIDYYQHRK